MQEMGYDDLIYSFKCSCVTCWKMHHAGEKIGSQQAIILPLAQTKEVVLEVKKSGYIWDNFGHFLKLSLLVNEFVGYGVQRKRNE